MANEITVASMLSDGAFATFVVTEYEARNARPDDLRAALTQRVYAPNMGASSMRIGTYDDDQEYTAASSEISGGVANVDGLGLGGRAVGAQCSGGGLGGGLVAVGDNDGKARDGQAPADFSADAHGAAGDDRDALWSGCGWQDRSPRWFRVDGSMHQVAAALPRSARTK